jgi:hypothetical protein
MSKNKNKSNWVTPVFLVSLLVVSLLAVIPSFPLSDTTRRNVILACWLTGWVFGFYQELKTGEIYGRFFTITKEKKPIQYWTNFVLGVVVWLAFTTILFFAISFGK